MSATLTFDEADEVTVRGKFAPGEKEKAIGEGNAKLKAEFKGGNSLLITAPGTFVIEAEFGKYDPATGDVRGGKITPLKSEKEVKVSEDLEK